MPVPYISSIDDLRNEYTNDPNKLIVLDFTATWCGPCKQISPLFETLAKETPGVNFLKIDIDESPDVAQEYGIASVPTFIFIKGDGIVHKFAGANPPALRDGVARLRNLAPSSA